MRTGSAPWNLVAYVPRSSQCAVTAYEEDAAARPGIARKGQQRRQREGRNRGEGEGQWESNPEVGGWERERGGAGRRGGGG